MKIFVSKNSIFILFSCLLFTHTIAENNSAVNDKKDIVRKKTSVEVGIESIKENGDNVVINIYSINEVPIAGVQFEIKPNNLFLIDSLSGGRCGDLDFMLRSNQRGVLLGFSMSGTLIPISTDSKLENNILFSAYGKKIKDINNQVISLETTIAGKAGIKINSKSNEYIYKK